MKFINYIALICSVFMISSCDSFLDKQEDEALTFEKIWSKRSTVEKYLNNVWGFMPDESNWVDENPWIGASDEASVTYNRGYRYMNFGTWSPSNVPYDRWSKFYSGIREANVFMQNIDATTAEDISEQERIQWKAEARYARAYYYFLLLRSYGPIMLVGDEPIDFNQNVASLSFMRNTYQECADYITKEMTECAAVLPLEQDAIYWGKPTKGAALSVIARLKLYSARPLFNGCELYAGIANPDGTKLFPTYDKNRWKEAAEANKRVIDLGIYELYEDESGNPIKSYLGVGLKTWNKEIIMARWTGGYYNRVHCTPRVVGGTAYGGIGPTQQLVDAYAMANGRYPIKGYRNDGTPIIDETSGYKEDGFSNFEHPYDQLKDGHKQKSTFNMYVGREPRFYATVLWSGADWPYMAGAKVPVFAFNGNSGPGVSHDYPKSGYICRRFIDGSLNSNGGQWGNLTFPIFRLAEIYLNYVEALNEFDPTNTDILLYLNKIRSRAGVPNIEEVYPEAVNNQSLMRELIRKERRIELAFETHRYFDTRTWMIAEQTDNGPMFGMNTMAPVANANTTPAAFWQRTEFEVRVFEPKHYLYPFSQRELDRNKQLTQNFGW